MLTCLLKPQLLILPISSALIPTNSIPTISIPTISIQTILRQPFPCCRKTNPNPNPNPKPDLNIPLLSDYICVGFRVTDSDDATLVQTGPRSDAIGTSTDKIGPELWGHAVNPNIDSLQV